MYTKTVDFRDWWYKKATLFLLIKYFEIYAQKIEHCVFSYVKCYNWLFEYHVFILIHIQSCINFNFALFWARKITFVDDKERTLEKNVIFFINKISTVGERVQLISKRKNNLKGIPVDWRGWKEKLISKLKKRWIAAQRSTQLGWDNNQMVRVSDASGCLGVSSDGYNSGSFMNRTRLVA